jgi:ABC-type transport system involved in multi-copper enzyme maturation permease subunit
MKLFSALANKSFLIVKVVFGLAFLAVAILHSYVYENLPASILYGFCLITGVFVGYCIAYFAIKQLHKHPVSAPMNKYQGTGSTTKDLSLTGKETTLKLSYEFYKKPDELIVYDQNGDELHHTGMRVTTKAETVMINLNGVTKLVFKIESKDVSSKWRFSVDVK